MPIKFNEDRRQLEHLAPLFFAFLLKFLTWHVALALAVVAIFYGLFVSPLFGTTRSGEPRLSGKFYYAVSVLFLLLVFRDQIEYAAAVWGVLAVGDSLSNMLGRRFGRRRLPWNQSKTWLGSVVFFASSVIIFLVFLAWFHGLEISRSSWTIALSVIVGLACALVESLPTLIDDNLLIAFTGVSFVILMLTVRLGELHPAASWQAALLINGLLAAAVYLLRLVTASGVFAGLLCGWLIYWGGGWQAFLLLFLFFIWGG